MGGNISWGKCDESWGKLRRLEKGGNRLAKIKKKLKKSQKGYLIAILRGFTTDNTNYG
jgi:hypothetical protein